MNSVQWLIDGEPGDCVDAGDRGLAYGDGLFETMAVRGGKVQRLELHLERLAEGCGRLAMGAPDPGVIAAEAGALAGGVERGVVKLIWTRGSGGRGYRPPAGIEPTRILGAFPWPGYAQAHYTRGIVLESVNVKVSENERLAGVKHLCRLEQVLGQLELEGREADEGLQQRADGAVVGGTSTNLFAVRDGRVVTPAIVKCGVRGVMRRAVIEACAAQGLELVETDLHDVDLRAAEELFVTNAVAGIRPVRVLDGRAYAVGPVTRRLQQALADEQA